MDLQSRGWIFDLDDTLHHASPAIFPQISRSMTAYVAQHLAISDEDASALRVCYWERYGATLLGLMKPIVKVKSSPPASRSHRC